MKTNGGRGPKAPPAALSDARELGAPHLALAMLAAAACVVIGVSHWIYETDVWEHLLVGKILWTEGRVFTTNVWSWPAYGNPNANPSWGFSALLWPFWSAGGVAGLHAWRWLTALATFALLFLAARRLGARGLAPLFVLVVAALVYRQRVQVRPETLAGVWFALAILLLERWRAAANASAGPSAAAAISAATPAGEPPDARRPGPPWLLVPLALAWANSHVSFYLLFVLIGFHVIDSWLGPQRAARMRALGLVAGAAALAALLNPFGARTLARPFEFLFGWRGEPFFASIAEIGPIVWSQNWSNGLPLLLAGWPLLLLRRARAGRVDRVEWLAAVAFTALALSSSRFVATYVLAAAPYVARDLHEWLAARFPAPRPASPWARAALASAAFVLVGLHDWTHNVAPLGLRLDPSRMPVRAADWIERHGVRGRAMNHFVYGGYVLWRFWPERDRLPFMDIHGEDSPREVRDAYVRAMGEASGWRALDDRFRFDWALFSRRYADRPGLLDTVDDDERWALVFADDVAALYLRRDGAMAPLAERFAYRTLGGSRATMGARVAAAARDSALRAAMLGELERQARESEVNFYGRSMQRALVAR